MKDYQQSRTVHINIAPLTFLLFLTFLILKLTDVISWSWWWVTAPLWAPPVLLMVLVLVLAIGGVTFSATEMYLSRRRRNRRTLRDVAASNRFKR